MLTPAEARHVLRHVPYTERASSAACQHLLQLFMQDLAEPISWNTWQQVEAQMLHVVAPKTDSLPYPAFRAAMRGQFGEDWAAAQDSSVPAVVARLKAAWARCPMPGCPLPPCPRADGEGDVAMEPTPQKPKTRRTSRVLLRRLLQQVTALRAHSAGTSSMRRIADRAIRTVTELQSLQVQEPKKRRRMAAASLQNLRSFGKLGIPKV